MTDPLEQRLRDAFEACAQSVQPENLDATREHQVADAVRQPPATTSRWGWRLGVAGLAAAAIVVGSLGVSRLDNSSDSQQADPLPPAASSEQTTATVEPGSSSAPSVSTAPTSLATSSTREPMRSHRTESPTAPSSSAPRPSTTSSAPAAPTTSSPPTTSATPPRMGKRSTTLASRLDLAVAATPTQGTSLTWSATATGTATSDTPSGGVLRYTVDHGDGTSNSHQVLGSCNEDASVRPVRFSTGQQQHDYQRSGTFQITVEVTYCGKDGAEETVTSSSNTVEIP